MSEAIARLAAALADRYRVERELGVGGMATVYLARDLKHERLVALKVLRPELGAVLGVERFLSEIRVTAGLQHPHILPLFDSGQAEGLIYYVMPHVEGEALRSRLDREKQLPIDDALEITKAVASALDYAHRHSVIHRDIKPENILFQDGQAVVADFGIALALTAAGGSRLTETGLSLGTPQYMSPEQATGERQIDARTDIYSLGAVLYEMLAGGPPHTGPTVQSVIAQVIAERPRRISLARDTVPPRVEAAVLKALEKVPADRFGSAAAFVDALTDARAIMDPSSSIPGAVAAPPARRPVVRRELIAWALAAAGVGAAVFVGGWGERTVTLPGPLEFDIQVPESVTTTPVGAPNTLALSSDGSTLVFQGTRLGRGPALYVRRMDDRQVYELPGTEGARAPTFSPDGADVLYSTAAQLMRVSMRGGSPRTVIDSVNPGEVSWGDGGPIVFALRDLLYTVPPEGGRRSSLAVPDSTRGHLRYGFPHVLPGGRAALITIGKGGIEIDSAVLGTVSIPDGDVRELGVRGTFARYSSTGHIVYATGDGWLSAVGFSPRTLRVSGDPFPIKEGILVGTQGAAAFDVARSGTIAYLRALAGDRRLVAVGLRGTQRDIGAPSRQYLFPRVSPDGSQLAVAVAPGLYRMAFPDIWRFDLTSRVLIPLTRDSVSGRPSWSPDGQRVAYVRYPQWDSTVMWRPLYGGATLVVRARHLISEIVIARAAPFAALRIPNGNQNSDDVWLVHLDSTTSPRPLLTEPYNESQPALSPDGKLLAYMADRTGRYEVYVRPVVGAGPPLQISADGGTEPAWGRRGRDLFYRGPDSVIVTYLLETPRLAVGRREALFRDVYQRTASWQASNYDVLSTEELLMLALVPAALSDRPIILMNWHRGTR